MSSRRLPVSRTLALAGLLLAAACGRHASAPGAAPPPLAVAVVRAHFEQVPVSVDAVGQAAGSRQVEIRGRVNGILEKRLYDEGAAVKAGAVLFLIDPVPYQLAVEDAKAALQLERAKRELAQTDARRFEPLAREKAISQRDLDTALATLRQSEASIASAEAKLKEAELDLSYTRVTAPIAGITGLALRSEGSLVTANSDSALLTTLTQVDPIWVLFPLAESDYARVRASQREARVQIVAEDGSILADHGRLNFASTTVDPKMGAVQLRAEFPNPRARWLPGQFVKVRVLAGAQRAMLIPQAAVLQTDQARLVMTVGPDGKVAPKPVRTANWIGQDVIVTGGLEEADEVIVDNLVKLRPGETVRPHPAGAAPAAPAPSAPGR